LLRLTVFEIVVHDCQPPVLGMVIGPVLLTPSASMWNVPPAPEAATLASIVYVPAAVTLTVYFNHSVGFVHPISYPPPESDVTSMSTSTAVVRYWPPAFPVVVSWNAMPAPP
jgi:hypothetical protein